MTLSADSRLGGKPVARRMGYCPGARRLRLAVEQHNNGLVGCPAQMWQRRMAPNGRDKRIGIGAIALSAAVSFAQTSHVVQQRLIARSCQHDQDSHRLASDFLSHTLRFPGFLGLRFS